MCYIWIVNHLTYIPVIILNLYKNNIFENHIKITIDINLMTDYVFFQTIWFQFLSGVRSLFFCQDKFCIMINITEKRTLKWQFLHTHTYIEIHAYIHFARKQIIHPSMLLHWISSEAVGGNIKFIYAVTYTKMFL